MSRPSTARMAQTHLQLHREVHQMTHQTRRRWVRLRTTLYLIGPGLGLVLIAAVLVVVSR
jgi:hypothetical protein